MDILSNIDWRFSENDWGKLTDILQPDSQSGPFVRDYLQRHIRMALVTARWVDAHDQVDERRKVELALSGIEACSIKLFGLRNPSDVVDHLSPVVAVIEEFSPFPTEAQDASIWEPLLNNLRTAHRKATYALEEISRINLTKQNEARDQMLIAAMRAWQRIHGKVPHAQTYPEKASRFDHFMHGVTEIFASFQGKEEPNSSTTRSAINSLRKKLPQTPLNFFCI